MTATTTLARLRWDQLQARPINLPLARKISALAKCPACGGHLIIDHDDDDHGNGRLHCLACGHEAAEIKVRDDAWPDWRR